MKPWKIRSLCCNIRVSYESQVNHNVILFQEMEEGSMDNLLHKISPPNTIASLRDENTSIVTPIVNKHGRCVAMVTINKVSDR